MMPYGQFRRLVRGSKWDVLRHSFISICAAESVDQRMLQSWVGHLSATTHKRYMLLIPGGAAAIRFCQGDSEKTSPPARLAIASRIDIPGAVLGLLTPKVRKRTEPSPKAKLAPPVCTLQTALNEQ